MSRAVAIGISDQRTNAKQTVRSPDFPQLLNCGILTKFSFTTTQQLRVSLLIVVRAIYTLHQYEMIHKSATFNYFNNRISRMGDNSWSHGNTQQGIAVSQVTWLFGIWQVVGRSSRKARVKLAQFFANMFGKSFAFIYVGHLIQIHDDDKDLGNLSLNSDIGIIKRKFEIVAGNDWRSRSSHLIHIWAFLQRRLCQMFAVCLAQVKSYSPLQLLRLHIRAILAIFTLTPVAMNDKQFCHIVAGMVLVLVDPEPDASATFLPVPTAPQQASSLRVQRNKLQGYRSAIFLQVPTAPQQASSLQECYLLTSSYRTITSFKLRSAT